ncbi:MAG TPA: LptF/LptG family permease [Bacteroidales bacterium]|nr:LptF/LptG family permease [Bacteroidales bacterium]
MNKWKLRIIDFYIIKKFLGTFFFALILIIGIAVIFDVSEKIDDFMEKHATLKQVVFDYYLNFIPYFAVLFSSLFTFIAVIFFTSKMAYNTEIIAILNSGMSFRRLMYPYMIGAAILATFSFVLSNYVIPDSNRRRIAFEEVYVRNSAYNYTKVNIHRQLDPGLLIYMERFSNSSEMGTRFSMERYKGDTLVSKLMSDYIKWDSIKNKWTIYNYYIRNINGLKETIVKGNQIDTTLKIHPDEFKRRENFVETMSLGELDDLIKEQKLQGTENINMMIIERDKRVAFPFSTFILTMIGVTVSTRKIRGGIGVQIGTGLGLSFSYILFMQFSSQFAISGTLSPFLAAWIPNIIFAVISVILYRMAPK